MDFNQQRPSGFLPFEKFGMAKLSMRHSQLLSAFDKHKLPLPSYCSQLNILLGGKKMF